MWPINLLKGRFLERAVIWYAWMGQSFWSSYPLPLWMLIQQHLHENGKLKSQFECETQGMIDHHPSGGKVVDWKFQYTQVYGIIILEEVACRELKWKKEKPQATLRSLLFYFLFYFLTFSIFFNSFPFLPNHIPFFINLFLMLHSRVLLISPSR